jgi:hypothetical protein
MMTGMADKQHPPCLISGKHRDRRQEQQLVPGHDPQSADVRRLTHLRNRTVPTLQRGSWFAKHHRDPCPSRAGAQTACQATSAARAPGYRLAAMMTAIKHIWQHKMRNSGQSHRLTGSLPWHLSGHGKG